MTPSLLHLTEEYNTCQCVCGSVCSAVLRHNCHPKSHFGFERRLNLMGIIPVRTPFPLFNAYMMARPPSFLSDAQPSPCPAPPPSPVATGFPTILAEWPLPFWDDPLNSSNVTGKIANKDSEQTGFSHLGRCQDFGVQPARGKVHVPHDEKCKAGEGAYFLCYYIS